jgi:hypothetical protein
VFRSVQNTKPRPLIFGVLGYSAIGLSVIEIGLGTWPTKHTCLLLTTLDYKMTIGTKTRVLDRFYPIQRWVWNHTTRRYIKYNQWTNILLKTFCSLVKIQNFRPREDAQALFFPRSKPLLVCGHLLLVCFPQIHIIIINIMQNTYQSQIFSRKAMSPEKEQTITTRTPRLGS